MNLSEAYAYQNYLANLQNEASGYAYATKFCLETTTTHYRSRSVQDAQDEVETYVAENGYPKCTPDQLVDFLLAVFEERESLSESIARAKNELLDAHISMNKARRGLISTLQRVVSNRGSKTQTVKTDWKLNADGEQVQYKYPAEEVTTPRYDRDKVCKLIRKLTTEANTVSTDIEKDTLYTNVFFVPAFDQCDDIEDAIQHWLDGQEQCTNGDACDIKPDN